MKEKEWFDRKECAKELTISIAGIDGLRKEGKLKFIQMGQKKSLRIHIKEIEKYIRDRERESKSLIKNDPHPILTQLRIL